MRKYLDYKYAKQISRGHDLKITLKKGPKGVGIFAIKNIKKGETVAYYKFILKNMKTYKPIKNNMYAITAYNKSGRANYRLIGDVFEGSIEKPRRNIPFWAHFSNEPNKIDDENVFLDQNLRENFKNRNRLEEGETMIYKLRALRDIKKGEELCWCYGSDYNRKYKTECK